MRNAIIIEDKSKKTAETLIKQCHQWQVDNKERTASGHQRNHLSVSNPHSVTVRHGKSMIYQKKWFPIEHIKSS